MKKFLSLLLAVLMIASLSTTAFAASETNMGTNSTSISVIGMYNEPNTDVISVDISWGAMEFTYTPASNGTWKPDTHSYDTSTAAAAKWEANGNTVTITNHSNVAVTAAFVFAPSAGGLTTSFTNSTINLATAENTKVANAPSGSTSFNITDGSITGSGSLGTIAVTISKQRQGN